MAIDLSAYSRPWAFARKTLHATAGNLDVITLPTWCKQVTIRAAGSGSVKVTHTGNQDAAIGSDYATVANGATLTLQSMQLSGFSLRLTGSVNGDPVEFILESGRDG